MKRKGSMTIAMSMMLLILLTLVATELQAIKNACERTQAVNAVDIGLYSLFSEYDPELLETYHLFFLDGGYGNRSVNPAQMINQMEHYMKPVLESGLTEGKVLACGVEGMRIATDQKGKAAEQQMVRYMKNNFGVDQMEKVRNMLMESKHIMEGQQEVKDAGIAETTAENTEPMKEISQNNNPLEIVKQIREYGLLGLVLPETDAVSERTMEMGDVVSKRTLQTGFGDFSELKYDSSALDSLWIQEYILEHMDTYVDQEQGNVLQYEAEYILGGKDSDQENLSYVVKRLLVIRELSNLAYLYTDPGKRRELEACAAALSLLTLIPEGMVLVQAVLAAGWAYVESLSDVKILLDGGKIPLIKDGNSWKTQLGRLRITTEGAENRGIEYEDYLRILFTMTPREKTVLRTMDLIEKNIRKLPGKENFSMDACVDAASFSLLFQGSDNRIWQADRMYSYDM